jgi:peptidoglycan/xylan/chitin deacetylase (PgdA/CDA1 family)
MLAVGAAVVLTGRRSAVAEQAKAGAGPDAPAAGLPPVPRARPGPGKVLFRGAQVAGRRIALTVDDGTSAEVVAGYVEFAQRSGVHLTLSPNAVYNHEWAPHAGVLRPLIAAGQVQIMNHTFHHHDLRTLDEAGIRAELERNDEWVIKTFGITTRPYYRPPYGFHNPNIDGVAAQLGYTRTVMWNGSFGDAKTITPEFLLSQARKYLQPGVIMLGHANHPTVVGLFDQLLGLIHDRQLEPVTLDEMFGTSRATGAAL